MWYSLHSSQDFQHRIIINCDIHCTHPKTFSMTYTCVDYHPNMQTLLVWIECTWHHLLLFFCVCFGLWGQTLSFSKLSREYWTQRLTWARCDILYRMYSSSLSILRTFHFNNTFHWNRHCLPPARSYKWLHTPRKHMVANY